MSMIHGASSAYEKNWQERCEKAREDMARTAIRYAAKDNPFASIGAIRIKAKAELQSLGWSDFAAGAMVERLILNGLPDGRKEAAAG